MVFRPILGKSCINTVVFVVENYTCDTMEFLDDWIYVMRKEQILLGVNDGPIWE